MLLASSEKINSKECLVNTLCYINPTKPNYATIFVLSYADNICITCICNIIKLIFVLTCVRDTITPPTNNHRDISQQVVPLYQGNTSLVVPLYQESTILFTHLYQGNTIMLVHIYQGNTSMFVPLYHGNTILLVPLY